VPCSHTCGALSSITSGHCIDRIALCYSLKIRYMVIWHVIFKALYIFTYGDTAIIEIESATSWIYLGEPKVDRHHRIIQNTHCICPSPWSGALLPGFQLSTQCVDPDGLLPVKHPFMLFVLFIMTRNLFIPCHPLATVLKLERLFLTNSLRIPCELRRSVDDGLSAF
jgi:hypothetical protein